VRSQRRCAQQLRQAIDCLPRRTREAMLDGVRENEIIVGAYTARGGGVCPMLAAHRRGGRTSLASFARAWDRYTSAGKHARPATPRELRTLTAMLEASLYYEHGGDADLATAAADHRALQAGRSAAAPEPGAPARDTGERNRAPELRKRHGWAWLRVFRRYDDFQAALAAAERAEAAGAEAADRRELELV
jgi:hypothetical protein